MKIVLPSNGYLGTSWVDIREPNFGDLRSTINATNQDDYLFKLEFVSRLANFDKEKVSMDDIQYMYDIAVLAVQLSTLKYVVVCPDCETRISGEYVFGKDESHLVTLSRAHKRCKKTLDGVEYQFNILSAADGEKIHTYALDDDENQKMLEDATVCRVLGKTINEENIAWVNQIPVSIYISAFLYIKANWHGMIMLAKKECPKCKKQTTTRIVLDTSWVKLDVPTLIASFAEIRDAVDFKSFLEFTVSEFNNLKDYVNNEVEEDE